MQTELQTQVTRREYCETWQMAFDIAMSKGATPDIATVYANEATAKLRQH